MGNSDPNSSNNQNQPNPNAAAWQSLENEPDKNKKLIVSSGFESGSRGKFVMGPDGKVIPKDDYDAAMEAKKSYENHPEARDMDSSYARLKMEDKEREEYYKSHPEARDMDAYYERLKEMQENPNRSDDYEGEHIRGASTHGSEYTTLNTMYAAAPDGSPLNNAARKEMARKMHEFEDATRMKELEADGRYKEYIERERAKIGSVYEDQNDFNHRVVARLEQLAKKQNKAKDQVKGDPNSSDADKTDDKEDPMIDIKISVKDNDKENNEKNEEGESEEDQIDKIRLDTARERFEELEREQLIQEVAKERVEDLKRIDSLKKDFETAHTELRSIGKELAEAYAKTRGLFNREKGKARARFNELREEYSAKLTQYLKAKAKYEYEKGEFENGQSIQAEKERIIEEIENGKITAEEGHQALGDKWEKLCDKLRGKISVDFVDKYLEEQKALENLTTHQIDNGNIYRKFVSKVINNKALKGVLAAAGIAGLAVTGFGLVTGTLALGSMSYTAGGIALGAGKGALSGLIMSRQGSKNSAVNDFGTNREELIRQLKELDASNDANTPEVKKVTDWLMNEYGKANQADRSSNRKRTLIATGLGAALGAAMSGVRINQKVKEVRHGQKVIDHEPIEQQATNLEQVNHAKGTGTQQLFRELGGDGDSYFSSGAHDQMAKVIQKYGMTVGENDWTYPGPLSEWPEVAREAFSEVANEWAKQGLVPATPIGGGPIYGPVTYTVDNTIASKLYNGVLGATTVIGAGLLGGAVAGRANRETTGALPNIQSASTVNPDIPVQLFDEQDQLTSQPEPSDIPIIDYEAPPVEGIVPVDETLFDQPDQATQLDQTTAQPDLAPDQTGNTAPAEDYDAATRNAFQGRVNEDVLNYMISDNDYNGLDGNMMQGRLMDVPQDVRREIAEYMDSHSDEPHGRALRQVIDLMRQNGQI